MKNNNTVIALIPFLLLLLFSSLVLLITNSAALSLNGFGVDSDSRVYVGRLYRIEIYDDGQMVSQINVPHHRNWSIDVRQNDTIVLSDSSVLYVMNLSGEILSESEDINGKTYVELRNQRIITGADGQEYRLVNSIGQTSIVDSSGHPVYKVPLIDVFTKISFGIAIIGLLILSPFLNSYLKRQLRSVN